MIHGKLTIRKPTKSDGKSIWDMVRKSGTLDLNSAYCYIMLGSYFSDTCAIAEMDGEPVGFVTGFRVPESPQTWFVWQIAVEEAARGQGVALKLLEHVMERPENAGLRWIMATISPSNKASRSLFQSLASVNGCECSVSDGFQADLFPGMAHEEECLYRIGPLKQQITTLGVEQ